MVRGGWPADLDLDEESALRAGRDYLTSAAENDMPVAAGARRGPERVMRLLQSLARHVAGEPTARTLAGDAGRPDVPITAETVTSYLDDLTRLFLVERQLPWSPKLRSKARVRQSAKLHFADTQLAASLLGATSDVLLRDLETAGLLFESFVFHELSVYAGALGGRIHHYRDSNGYEVDQILVLGDGRWAAIEVKLGEGAVDAAVASLTRFRDHVDLAVSGVPAFMAVITAAGYAYRHESGVFVLPVGALEP